MEMRYMTYKNEEGQKERLYPITHKDAIIGLSDIPEVSGNDLISTEAASEIVGDAPEIDPAIVDLVNSLTAEDVEALPIQIITCAYGNTDEEIIKGLSENWNKLSNGIGSIQFSNGVDIWYGTYYKYTDTIGSILMQNASGAYSKKFIRGNNTLIDLYTKDNKPTASDLSSPVNNNILINSNFANPVNQRGYVSGTDIMSGYSVDRWRGNLNFLLVENSYTTFRPITGTTANTVFQLIENPAQYVGKKLTMSVKCRTSTPEEQIQLFADGTANGSYSSLGYYVKHLSKANEWEVITQTFNIPYNYTFSDLKFGTNTGGTFDVEWMKLEIGDHATPYVPRLYAEELALCQRYYQKYNRYSSRTTGYRTLDVRHFYATFRYSEMRVYPSVKSGTIYLNNVGDSDRIELTKSDYYALGNGYIQFSGYTNNLNKTDGTFDIYDIELDAEL